MRHQILEMKQYKAVKLVDPKHPEDYVLITKSVKPYKRAEGDLQATMMTTEKGKPKVISDKPFPPDWEQAIKYFEKKGLKVVEKR